MKRFLKTIGALSAFVLTLSISAILIAQPALYVEGSHYETLEKPVRTVDPNKIEVAEIFWYGCPHCFAFEPVLEPWIEKLPSDVNFVRSPGMWNALMETHARIYYVAEALGVLDDMHTPTFDAIHKERNYLQTDDEIRKLFVANGVNPEEFDKTWKSFSTVSAVKQAGARMRDYGVRGVPAIIVNGKYRVTGTSTTTQAEQLKIAEFLIAKERSGN